MKPPQIFVISGAALGGLVIGLVLAPFLLPAGLADIYPSQVRSTVGNSSGARDVAEIAPLRTRVKNRETAVGTDEPSISIPVKTMVSLLREGSLGGTEFKRLEKTVGPALEILGASQTECEEIKNLIRKSKDEVQAAEKTHFKLALAAPDHIEIDTSGIREPISDIIGRLQSGIHATLTPQSAEILVSAIDWNAYYRINEKAFITSLEVDRDENGELLAQVIKGSSSTGGPVDKKFPDDGTPLPADQVFPELWRPYLKGLTVIPKAAK